MDVSVFASVIKISFSRFPPYNLCPGEAFPIEALTAAVAVMLVFPFKGGRASGADGKGVIPVENTYLADGLGSVL